MAAAEEKKIKKLGKAAARVSEEPMQEHSESPCDGKETSRSDPLPVGSTTPPEWSSRSLSDPSNEQTSPNAKGALVKVGKNNPKLKVLISKHEVGRAAHLENKQMLKLEQVHHEEFTVLVRAKIRNLHEDYQDRHPADWVDLFFDLFYVAASVGMSGMISHTDLSPMVYVTAIIYGDAFFAAWLFLTLLRSAFHLTGIVFWVLIMFYMASLLGSAAEFDAYHKYRRHWVYWKIMLYATQCALIVAPYRHLKKYRPFLKLILVFSVAIPLIAHIAVIPFPVSKDQDTEKVRQIVTMILFALGVYSDIFFRCFLSFLPAVRRRVEFPILNMHHLVERFQLLMMVLLGESLISVVVVTSGNHNFGLRMAGVCGTATTCCLATNYFSTQPHDTKKHAMKKGLLRSFLFVNISRMQFIFVLGFGCALKTAMLTMPMASMSQPHRRLDEDNEGTPYGDPNHEQACNFVVLMYLGAQYCITLSRFTHESLVIKLGWHTFLAVSLMTPLIAGLGLSSPKLEIRLFFTSVAACATQGADFARQFWEQKADVALQSLQVLNWQVAGNHALRAASEKKVLPTQKLLGRE